MQTREERIKAQVTRQAMFVRKPRLSAWRRRWAADSDLAVSVQEARKERQLARLVVLESNRPFPSTEEP